MGAPLSPRRPLLVLTAGWAVEAGAVMGMERAGRLAAMVLPAAAVDSGSASQSWGPHRLGTGIRDGVPYPPCQRRAAFLTCFSFLPLSLNSDLDLGFTSDCHRSCN